MPFTRNSAFENLRRAHESGRLAHAYLISGPPGSGKRALVSDLTSLVTGATPTDVFESQPMGVYLAEPESKSRRILIEQVRDLERALHMRSSGGRRKVAIIAEADRLQPQAANAFLKTLEEPPNDSLLLLVSSIPEALPETILSRCIALPLAVQEEADLSAEEEELVELLGTVVSEETRGAHSSYRLLRGYQRLLAQIRETIQKENTAAQKSEESRYRNTTDGTWLKEREDYFKALTESQYVQKRSQLIETLFLWWSDVLRANTGAARRELPSADHQTRVLAGKLSTAEILGRIRRLEEMRDHLGRNIQEALALEVAFLSIFTF